MLETGPQTTTAGNHAASTRRDYDPTVRTLHNEIKADLFRYAGATGAANLFWAYFRVPGFRYTIWWRVTHWCWHRGGVGTVGPYFIGRLMLARLSYKLGFQISHRTSIGPGLHLGHFGAIVINGKVSIGANANLSVGAVIGRTNRGRKKGVPTIGNNVWIGANAVVVGGITIGDGALVAPGAYVNFDVPPNAVVVGNPGKIVSMLGSEDYVNNQWSRTA